MFIQQVQTCISFFYDILVLVILDFHDFSADCMWFQEGRRLQCSCFSLLTPPSAAQRLAVVLVQEPQQHKPSTLLSSKQPLWSVVEAQWPKHCLIQAKRQTLPKFSKCLEKSNSYCQACIALQKTASSQYSMAEILHNLVQRHTLPYFGRRTNIARILLEIIFVLPISFSTFQLTFSWLQCGGFPMQWPEHCQIT